MVAISSKCYDCHVRTLPVAHGRKRNPISAGCHSLRRKVHEIVFRAHHSLLPDVIAVAKSEKKITSLLVVSSLVALTLLLPSVAAITISVHVIGTALLVASPILIVAGWGLMGAGVAGWFTSVTTAIVAEMCVVVLADQISEFANAKFRAEHLYGFKPERYKGKNVCLIVEAEHRDNAFSSLRSFAKIDKKMPIVLVNSRSFIDMIRDVDSVKRDVGDIKMLVIRGHGNYDRIRLGYNKRESTFNKMIMDTDAHRSGLRYIDGLLAPSAPIVLDSCLTASSPPDDSTNIASVISSCCPDHDVWGSTRSYISDHLILKKVTPFSAKVKAPPKCLRKILAGRENLTKVAVTLIPSRLTPNACIAYRNGARKL